METNGATLESRFTIHDMAGMLVKELVLSEKPGNTNLGLPSGTYTIRFRGSDGNLLSNTLVILRA